MSTGALAAAVGLAPALVAEIEAGHFDPPYDVLLALSDALGVEASELVELAAALEDEADA